MSCIAMPNFVSLPHAYSEYIPFSFLIIFGAYNANLNGEALHLII